MTGILGFTILLMRAKLSGVIIILPEDDEQVNEFKINNFSVLYNHTVMAMPFNTSSNGESTEIYTRICLGFGTISA